MPAAVLSQTFQAEDVDAVTVSSAMSTVRKQLDSLQEKQVHKLQTVKHYLDKVENEGHQDIKISGFANAIEHLSKDANCYIQLLNDAIEARLGGSSDIASILNCEAWDFGGGNESMDEVILHNVSHFQEPLKQQGLQVSQLQVVDEWHDMLDHTVQYLSPSRHYRATWYKIFHSSKKSFAMAKHSVVDPFTFRPSCIQCCIGSNVQQLGKSQDNQDSFTLPGNSSRNPEDPRGRTTNGDLRV